MVQSRPCGFDPDSELPDSSTVGVASLAWSDFTCQKCRAGQELVSLERDTSVTQRAQYPLITEYGLNYIGLHILI